jgi:hypothetical protein
MLEQWIVNGRDLTRGLGFRVEVGETLQTSKLSTMYSLVNLKPRFGDEHHRSWKGLNSYS